MRKTLLVVAVVSLVVVPSTGSADTRHDECIHEKGSGKIICFDAGDCTGYETQSGERWVCVDQDGTEVCVGPEGWGHADVCHDPVETADMVKDDAEAAARSIFEDVNRTVNQVFANYSIADITGPANRTLQNASDRARNAAGPQVNWSLNPCANGGDGVKASVTYDGKTVSEDDSASANASQDGAWDQYDVWSCDEVNLTVVADLWNRGYSVLEPALFADPCRAESQAGAQSRIGEARGRLDARLGGEGDPCAGVDGGADLGLTSNRDARSGAGPGLGVSPPPRQALLGSDGTAAPPQATLLTFASETVAGQRSPFADAGPGVRSLALLGTLAAGWVLVRMYRRLTADDVLDNEIRSSMLELVEERPAINAGTIADELGIAVATVLYHGRIMDEMGHVELRRDGREVIFYSEGKLQPVEKAFHKVAKQETKLAILDAIEERPGASMSELARLLDKHRSTVKHHVDDMVARDLIVKRDAGRSSRLELAGPTARAMGSRNGQ